MAKRYQHVTDPVLHDDVGKKVGGLLWGGAADGPGEPGEDAA